MLFIRKQPAQYLILLVLFVTGCTTMDRHAFVKIDKQASSAEKSYTGIKNNAESGELNDYTVKDNADTGPDSEKISAEPHTDQEIIDSALEYCQASNDFWEKGDLDSAIDCLDKAYSLTLKINSSASPVIVQEKEDLRITIAKRMLEVYSSRFTTVNGFHKAIPLVMNSHVQKAIDLFTGRENEWFMKVYARSGKYRPAIVRELKKSGLPEELSWLPLIESGFSTTAISSARALGMWQFIASTGYKYGLNRDAWIDERMNPEKATKSAIAYLTELHQIFGDWTTALAAYNCGEARVLRVISTQKINYMDNFWDLYEKLPNETAFYVPKFLAVLHIINNPSAYGITLPPLEPEVEFDKININKQISLKTLATEMFVDHNYLRELNSELRQNVTPKTAYELKVPKGKGEILVAKLNDMPTYTPSASSFSASATDYRYHKIKNGESLSTIAHKYNTSINAIMAINKLKSKNRLKAGAELKIPAGKYTYVATYTAPSGNPTKYTVQKGDTLWKIADRFGTTVKSIKAINGIDNPSLRVGQELMITGEEKEVTQGDDTRNYTVRQGDSPYLIAKKHSMNLSEFLTLNNLEPSSTIFPGQEVRIFTR